MKVLLLFPPQWVPYYPHLALPSLAAFLRSNGVETVQKDLNVGSYNQFLTRKYLRSLKSALDSKFDEFNSKPRLSASPEQQVYSDIFIAKSSLYHLADNIEDAVKVFRGRRYYNAETLNTARKTIENALTTVSIAHYPARLELMSFSMPEYDGKFETIEKLTSNIQGNPYFEYFEKNVLPYVREQAPGVIGISIAGESQLIPALTLARLVKKNFDCHVVLGGYVVTLLADSLTRHRKLFEEYCDSLLVLEGERPLLELVRRLESHQSLESVPNLIYFDDGSVRANQVSPPEPMEGLPAPDFDGLPLQEYLAPDPVLPVLASRGCYWGRCAFCSHNVSYENKYRPHSGEKIVADLEALHRKYGVKHFAFSDEAIAPKVMREVTSRLIEDKTDFRFSTNIRIEPQFTPALCETMHIAGFRVVYLGQESGCDRVLGLMKKGFNKDTAIEVCRNLVNAGIWDHLYIFLGFPGESENDAQETITFLSENASIIRSFNLGSFSLGRGSEVMRMPGDYGIKISQARLDDLAMVYSYAPSSGISSSRAAELSREAWAILSKEYPTSRVLDLLSKEDLLLYLSHFESTDPALTKIKRSPTVSAPGVELTLDSQLKTSPGVFRTTLNFDLPDIMKNLLLNWERDAVPSPVRVLFDPENRKIRPIGPNVSEMLDLLGRGRTIRMIARQLSQRHNIPEAAVEAFCLDALNQLKNEGYLAADKAII
ncbi:B12-binding domain-containing radical SAM protein [Dehalogenimonas etheniformans]|nr:radical SAM protein [Dehalogenimonas etheniformans]QNT75245.1 radical SAM protein [Dehalogenimonas etheniformans]